MTSPRAPRPPAPAALEISMIARRAPGNERGSGRGNGTRERARETNEGKSGEANESHPENGRGNGRGERVEEMEHRKRIEETSRG